VSTEDQTTANQLEQLREMAARRGWTVVTEHVVTGSAWTGKHRATLDDALRGARLGEFDVLLVWSLDRISREGVEATLGILRKFRQHGVPVISRQEPWTDSRPASRRVAVEHLRVDGPRGVGPAQRADQGWGEGCRRTRRSRERCEGSQAA
jgi:DNA invertase Pin-like site-specific DNA recombinase